ncbi:hypothetical protein SAMN05421812_12360 [Asanoa hainanensis]|uniref:Uncharacterized protein n=1 Tax=Asanoa hainanensis TaxID=560556 RepID=A0A239PEL0_9ACTN|nr:DUF6069 family protein [Asanoa hainanensis]SNT65507.1 hypothetical protein SAMN05421812_12360 [Asanoa hainanensis]
MSTRTEVARRAGIVCGGTAAALLVWLLATPVLGVDLTVRVPAGLARSADLPARDVVGPGQVAAVAAGAGVLAWALLAGLERLTRHAAVVWLSCALPVLILSLAGPLAATSAAGLLALAGMHLAVGVVLVPGLALTPPARIRRDSTPEPA